MPIELRQGQLKLAPTQKFKNAYHIFRIEQSKDHKDEEDVNKIGKVADAWNSLDVKIKSKYQNQYEEYQKEFKDQLFLFYGGQKEKLKELNIPEKPKKPLNSSLRYQLDVLQQVRQLNPTLKEPRIRLVIGEMYRNLSDDQRSVYEKAYEKEKEIFNKQLKEWNEKYQQKDHNSFIEAKYKKLTEKTDDFVYQELQPKKAKKLHQQKSKSVGNTKKGQ